MLPHEAAAQAEIRRLYAVSLLYTGAGLSRAPVSAIKSDGPAPDFTGEGATLRETSFEVDQADLPGDPRKGDRLYENETRTDWRVIDITRRDDVGAWRLIVENPA